MNNPHVSLDDMRVVELFAGVGGFRIGFEGPPENSSRKKFRVVWANQWEPSTKIQHAAQVYISKWELSPTDDPLVYSNGADDIFVNQDISLIDAESIPDHDLLCGGFPCQDYSVAKTLPTAHGISGKKGVLWWEIHRILEEKRPHYLLLENVDRLLKSPRNQRGRDFAVMLASLNELGYAVEWRVIDASEYGFPQRRKRVFIFAEQNGKLKNPHSVIEKDGVLARAFPIHELDNVETFSLSENGGDLADISSKFNVSEGDKKSPFGNGGVMKDGTVWTSKCLGNYDGEKQTLGGVLQTPGTVPDEYILDAEAVLRAKGWIYLKGGKKEMREGRDGFTYKYSEGPVTFPDALERPSRTIVTGEGGKSPSRFKHVVKFRPTKGQIKRLKLDEKLNSKVRGRLSLKKTEWVRRLTPLELERLNGFPDNHTGLVSDGRRAFFMGNALVCGVVSRICHSILIHQTE